MARIRPIDSYRWTDEERQYYLQELLKDAKPKTIERMAVKRAGDHLKQAMERLQYGDRLVGLSSGFSSIDKLTKGMLSGELTVLFGISSHGKSQTAQNIAVKMAKKGVKSMFVGLEMTAPENTGRFYQMASMGEEEFIQLPILYPDVKQIDQKDIDALFDSARENGCQVLFFDHLHYLSRSVTHSQEEIGVIVNNFKRAAVRTNIHAVLISHVVKNVRRDRIPSPGDLKGSSFIEQDADMVIAVWRDMEQNTGEVLLKIWKNRNRGFNPEESVATLQVLDKVRLAEQVNLSAFGG